MKASIAIRRFALCGLALAALLLACGGEGTSSTGGYFERLEALDEEFDQRNDELAARFDELQQGTRAAEDEVAQFVETFEDATAATRDFVDGLTRLGPPSAVEEQHNQATKAGQAYVATMTLALDSLDGAGDQSEAIAIVNEVFSSTQFERFDAACVTLQEAADENGADIDLDCAD